VPASLPRIATSFGWRCVGSILLAVFFLVQARSSNPMLPLVLFRSRNFAGANLLTIFLYTALAGAMFFLSTPPHDDGVCKTIQTIGM
jgi:hypothetical protein